MKTQNTPMSRAVSMIIMVCIAAFTTSAQSDKLIQPKQLQKDLDVFLTVLDAHPDPYTHVSEKDFNKAVNRARKQLNEPHTELGFYKQIAQLLALVKDGHSSIYMPEFWYKNISKDRGMIPIEIHVTNDNQMYLIKKYIDLDIPIGSKIETINGMSVEDFIEEIDPYISYEQLAFRNSVIESRFEFYLYLVFGSEFELTLDYFSTESNLIKVPFMSAKDHKKFKKATREDRDKKIALGKPYEYKKLKDGIGVLELYGFYAEDVEGYEVFLYETFKEIRKDSITSLIIDIRENLGGWPKIGSYIFHSISETHFKTMAQSSMKVSKAYRKFFLEKIPLDVLTRLRYSKRRHFVDLESIMTDPIDSYVNEDIFFNEQPITKKYEFYGDTYLLTDRRSFSAASSFASTFQCYRMGYVVGEETGGTKVFRANPIGHTLPKSRLRVRMSTTLMYSTCYNDELEGVKPDVEFRPSVVDLGADFDSQLVFTMRLIKKVQKERMKAQEK